MHAYVEASGSHGMSCSITACFIPMRQRRSWNLERHYQPASFSYSYSFPNSMLPAFFPSSHGCWYGTQSSRLHITCPLQPEIKTKIRKPELRSEVAGSFRLTEGRWEGLPEMLLRAPLLCPQCRVAAIIVEGSQGEEEGVDSDRAPGHLTLSSSFVCPETSHLFIF